MSDNTPEIPDSLRAKFPELRPLKRVPPLMRVNGIGVGMYGRRDADSETGTYVKTHCICLVFVPILALGAYRVADAERGWYFIGKERLSSFAKSCNFGVLLLSFMFAGIVAEHSYKSSPDYIAKQELRRADQSLRSGKPLDAARIYRDVALGSSAQAEPAWRGLHDSLEQSLTNDSPEKVEATYRLLATLPPKLNSPAPVVPDARQRGLALVEKFRANNPDGAIDLLRQVALLAGPTNASLQPLEIELLKAAIAAKPDNTNRVVELALIYEEQKQLAASYELLAPYSQKLGATEGARILGQHLLEEGKYEDAYRLLYPYVQARLERLRGVERNYTNTMATLYKRTVKQLNDGQGDPSFYEAYKKASKPDKEALVDGYVQKRMENDPSFKRAVADLTAANKIVHVTLDLGMVQLNRAQNLTDPAARKTELEAAEQTFLAIQGLAGGTDAYRLFLGQVYYWLGKSKEGGELFAQLLAAHKRAYPLLMQLAHTLRAVGDETQSRDLCEEAYRTGKSNEDRFGAAMLRSHLPKDMDDRIAWLEKADPGDVTVQIELNNSRGGKALRDGNRELAAQFYRKAIEGYQNRPQTSTVLNNCGLVYLNLYLASGNIADHNRGLALVEQAMALSPGDSVLFINITHLFITRAHMDVVGDAIHFAALKESPNHAMLAHLYKDEQGRAALIRQLRQNEHMKKALTYLDKALLLAPKNPSLYDIGLRLQENFGDLAELQKLQQRLRVAAPDLTETTRETREAYDPAKDKDRLDRLQKEARRYQALLESPAVKEHPLTLEFAELELNELEQWASLAGASADSQKLLDQALATHQRLPTSAGQTALITTYFFCVHDQLKQQSPAYAELAERTRRALAPRELIAFLLDRNDALAPLIRQNPNMLKALELLKERGHTFPSFRQTDEWALFRTIDADEATRVVQQLKNNQVSRLADELRFQLNPLAGSVVMRQYWNAKMNGDQPAAAALYQEALRNSVPLPPAS
jgi:tetratricopeptide (TPR) repeat protein